MNRRYRAPGGALVLTAAVLLAGAGCAQDDAAEDAEDVSTVASAATLAPSTSVLADVVDARCGTGFTDADRAAIETAIRASSLGGADRMRHALNRFGYGDRYAGKPLPADVAATIASGVYASLRAGGSIPSGTRSAMIDALPTLARPSGDVHYEFRKLYKDRDAARAAGDATTAATLDQRIVAMRDTILDELAGKQLMAATLSTDFALGERLTSFWLNHFNVDGLPTSIWAPAYEWTIRSNVCGTFAGMLKEVARSPAMLKFLDNYASTAPGVTHWSGTSGINENYARELLELHTLGTGARTSTNTGSPYTQNDVIQTALTLTGWSYTYATDQRSTFFKFFPEYHAGGSKTVMGKSYAAGEAGGLALLTDLANHGRTKSFICRKLAGQFFAEKVPATVVDACVAKWGSGGQLPRMITAILSRSETWESANFANKVKNPFELVVSSHRLSGDDARVLTWPRVKQAIAASKRMGLWLWRTDPPTGYATHHLDWLDAGYLDEQVRYVYSISDPSGLDLTLADGTVLRDAPLENRLAGLAPATAFDTARTKILPLRGIPFTGKLDTAFLQTAFTLPDLAPGSSAPERPLRTLLTFYASSWQFTLE